MSETRFHKGPWRWMGTPTGGFYLATEHSGHQYVMSFDRLGLNRAQPVFQPVHGRGMVKAKDLCIFEVCRDATSHEDPRVYRRDIVGFRCPDAHLIAAAPDLYEALDCAEEVMTAVAMLPDDVRKLICSDQMLTRRLGAARSALRKARGET